MIRVQTDVQSRNSFGERVRFLSMAFGSVGVQSIVGAATRVCVIHRVWMRADEMSGRSRTLCPDFGLLVCYCVPSYFYQYGHGQIYLV